MHDHTKPLLHNIAYVSHSIWPLGPTLLSDILEVSQRNNARDEITGILKYHDQQFFQILEGEQSVVQLCFERIVRDPRHINVSQILDDSIMSRTFGNWTMSYAGPDEIGPYTPTPLKPRADFKGDGNASSCLALELAYQIFLKA